MLYFVPLWTSLEHLCITLYTYRIYCSTISSLYFICNGFSHFYYLLSQLFWFFKFYFLLYIYILWFYILLSLRCFGSAFLYMAVFFSFLSHFWCRNLFLVRITPFSQPCYISVYRLLFCLKILRCLCVVTSWFATITFPISAYIASLCARTSMFVDPQHQYIVFLKQFLKGGFYTGKIWAPPTAEITRSNKRRFLHSRKGKFLFHFSPASMPTTLIQAPAFSDACAKRGFYTGKTSYNTLHLWLARQCSPAIAKARFPPCTICSRNRQYTEKTLKKEILPRQKRGFYMLILADWAVAISFYSLLNLLHPVWKSLSPSVFSSLLACGNLSFYIL